MKTFFTADTHFMHRKICEYCPNRGYTTEEDHDAGLVSTWNETVGEKDEVWVLGDLCFGTWKRVIPFLERLNGHIHLIPGNHDNGWYKKKAIKNCPKITIHPHHMSRRFNGTKVIMTHFPYATWAGDHKNVWNLHGHQHANGDVLPMRRDVGWDVFGKPVTLDEIFAHSPIRDETA